MPSAGKPCRPSNGNVLVALSRRGTKENPRDREKKSERNSKYIIISQCVFLFMCRKREER